MVSTTTSRLRHLLIMTLGQEELGQRIKQAREDAHLSQRDLADKLGLKHPQSISRYERGIHEVPPRRLRQIAEVTNHPLSYFVGDGEALGFDREQGEAIASRLERALDRLEDLLGEPPEARDEPRSG